MPEAIFVIVAHFTVLGYGGDVLPEKFRTAYPSIEACRQHVSAARKSIADMRLSFAPDIVRCERLEIRK